MYITPSDRVEESRGQKYGLLPKEGPPLTATGSACKDCSILCRKWQYLVCFSRENNIANKKTAAEKAPPQRGINQIPFMSRAQGHRIISGGLALHYIG